MFLQGWTLWHSTQLKAAISSLEWWVPQLYRAAVYMSIPHLYGDIYDGGISETLITLLCIWVYNLQFHVFCVLCCCLFTKIICIVSIILENTFISKSNISKVCVLTIKLLSVCLLLHSHVSFMCTIILVWKELFQGFWYIRIFIKYSLTRHWLAGKVCGEGTE